jgi:hypothetical protein
MCLGSGTSVVVQLMGMMGAEAVMVGAEAAMAGAEAEAAMAAEGLPGPVAGVNWRCVSKYWLRLLTCDLLREILSLSRAS